jgi:hypothetical protein
MPNTLQMTKRYVYINDWQYFKEMNKSTISMTRSLSNNVRVYYLFKIKIRENFIENLILFCGLYQRKSIVLQYTHHITNTLNSSAKDTTCAAYLIKNNMFTMSKMWIHCTFEVSIALKKSLLMKPMQIFSFISRWNHQSCLSQ